MWSSWYTGIMRGINCTMITSTVLHSTVVIEALLYTIPLKEATQHPSTMHDDRTQGLRHQ